MLQAFQREVTGQKIKKTTDQKSSSHPIKSLASTRCVHTLDLGFHAEDTVEDKATRTFVHVLMG